MSEQLPWRFEPCSPEDVCDPTNTPWAHAVRGRKPARPAVVGYGHSISDADFDARAKASQQDAREVLGERGEVVMAIELVPSPDDLDMIALRKEIREYFSQPHEWKIV